MPPTPPTPPTDDLPLWFIVLGVVATLLFIGMVYAGIEVGLPERGYAMAQQYTPPCQSGGAPCAGTGQPTFPPYIAGAILTQPIPNNATQYGTNQFGQIVPSAGAVLLGVTSASSNATYWQPYSLGVTCSGSPTSSFASVDGIVVHC